MNPFRTVCAFLLTLAVLPAADPGLLNLVGRDPRMVAGVDVVRARDSAFGQKVLGEFRDEDANFRKFLDATGFDPRRDMREILMVSDGGASDGKDTLILVRGLFQPAKISGFMRQEGKVPSVYRGVEIWGSENGGAQDGAVALLNSSTAIFGGTALVKEAIDRSGFSASGMSPALQARIRDWSGKTDAWFIAPGAFSELGVGKSGNNRILPNGIAPDAIREAAGGVRFGSELEISGEAVARSDKDALALADVLRFFANMVRLNAKPGMEGALQMADSMKVETSGATTRFSFLVPEQLWNQVVDGKPGRTATQKTQRKSPEVI